MAKYCTLYWYKSGIIHQLYTEIKVDRTFYMYVSRFIGKTRPQDGRIAWSCI